MSSRRHPMNHGSGRHIVVAALCWAACAALLTDASRSADDTDEDRMGVSVPVTIPVKTLTSRDSQPVPTMESMAVSQPQPSQLTLPGGKLPQYQLGNQSGTMADADRRDDPRLRLILALPSQPLLLQAVTTIDGQPFPMAREQRIAALLEAAKSSVASPEGEGEQTDSAEPSASSAPDERDAIIIAPDDPKAEASDAQDEAVVTAPTVPPYSLAGSSEETVRRFLAAVEGGASPEEIRWLLTHWIDGPTVLMLNENFQRFRANERPVFDILDRDRDETVSAEELARAAESFHECDLNRDDIVDVLELAEAAHDPRRKRAEPAVPAVLLLPLPLPDADSADPVFQRLASYYRRESPTGDKGAAMSPGLSRFDTNSDGRFDVAERQTLYDTQPDIELTIAFDSRDATKSTLTVTAVRDELLESELPLVAEGSTITLSLAETTLAFSAVQANSSDQISVGTVADGYPLLPEVDPNDDGRFTLRELRTIVDRLRKFDRNDDGQLTIDEVRAPLRICFGLGPHVHRELAGIRSVSYPEQSPTVVGPEWFVRMDRNRDNDLTRGEFPGTDEQFGSLDGDADGLVSGREAHDFDAKSATPTADFPETKPESKSASPEPLE